MSTIKDKISNFMFEFFYIALFILQMLPSLILPFIGTLNIWFWIACTVGLIALITQAIKFPCFATRLWNSASIGSVIGMAIVANYFSM